MPTFSHGKNSKFYISDGTTTPTVTGTTQTVSIARVYDVSTVSKEVNFPSTMDTAETSAFGTGTKTYVQGLRGATLSISGSWDGLATMNDSSGANAVTPDALFNGLIGAAQEVKFIYAPAGHNAAGRVRYSGSAVLTSYNVTGSLGDLVAFTAEFQVTGDVTRQVTV